MARRKRNSDPVHGLLVVDKEPGFTSHDVVALARRALGTQAVGHTGTLDPSATGLLILVVGEATKLSRYLSAEKKSYEAIFRLGSETDTLDADGQIIATQSVPEVDTQQVQKACNRFLGFHKQKVPIVSAVRVQGKRLHEIHRKQKEEQKKGTEGALSENIVEAPSRQVELKEVRVLDVDKVDIRIRLKTGSGFYVRSFCRDLAHKLHTIGHVTQLRRTSLGSFAEKQAHPMQILIPNSDEGDREGKKQLVRSHLISMAEALQTFPCITLDAKGSEDAFHGRAIHEQHILHWHREKEDTDTLIGLIGETGKALALARQEGELLHVVRGFRM